LSAADLLTTARSREGLIDAEVAPFSYISNNMHICASQIYTVFTSNLLEGYLNWPMGTSPLYLIALLTQMTTWKGADRK